MIIFFMKVALLAVVIWSGMKVGIGLTQRLSGKKKCSNCGGLGYWEGVRERNICKDCNGTGLVKR